MAETKNKNKVVYDGEVLIDLTADTVTPDKLAKRRRGAVRQRRPVLLLCRAVS